MKDIYMKVDIENIDEIKRFAEALSEIPEYKKLKKEEKWKILFSYPFKLKCTKIKKRNKKK